MIRLLIVGASGHAKVILDAVRLDGNFLVVGFLDDNKPNSYTCYEHTVLGSTDQALEIVESEGVEQVVIAVGENSTRSLLVDKIKSLIPKIRFATIIHPNTTISSSATIAEGTVVMAGAVINADSKVGKHCIVNTLSSVEHDVKLDDYCSLAPGATTGGNAKIGKFSAVGLGANILHGITIGSKSVIGAGAVVINNIPDNSVAVGIPAEVVKSRQHGDNYL